jgi:hypothetical protein
MSPAERAAYGSFCEDCTVGLVPHNGVLEKFNGSHGFAALPVTCDSERLAYYAEIREFAERERRGLLEEKS